MAHGRQTRRVTCRCGATEMEAAGAPIASASCHCGSCDMAAKALQEAFGAEHDVGSDGGVPYLLFRKDRVALLQGDATLAEHRLTPDSPTRRVVATCCGSPMFLDFTPGHWLSLYASRLVDPVPAPSLRAHSARFLLKLLGAWAAMGFRRPKAAF